MTLTDHEATLFAAGIAAVSATIVVLLTAFVARIYVGRDRRRQIFGEAFRAALEWLELLYRVRRRDNTREQDREIVDRFHDLQERLDFYEGWIGSESKYMRRSFTALVDASKRATKDDIQAAWDKRGKSGNADPGDTHPAIDPVVKEAFLRDVRAHLSSSPWRWAGVAWRNRRCC